MPDLDRYRYDLGRNRIFVLHMLFIPIATRYNNFVVQQHICVVQSLFVNILISEINL